MGSDLLLADDQLRRVADPLLALVDGDQVAFLRRRAEGDVATAVVVEGLGVRFPDLDAGGHQLGHGRLEVVVADHPAGDPGGAGGHVGLVDHEHVVALLGEVPGGREAVNAGADDERGNGGGKRFGHVHALYATALRIAQIEHKPGAGSGQVISYLGDVSGPPGIPRLAGRHCLPLFSAPDLLCAPCPRPGAPRGGLAPPGQLPYCAWQV